MMLKLCKPFTTSLINAFCFSYGVRFPSLGYYKERHVVEEEWWVEEIVDLDNIFLHLGNARVVLLHFIKVGCYSSSQILGSIYYIGSNCVTTIT